VEVFDIRRHEARGTIFFRAVGMKERQVQDPQNNVAWKCVQALSAISEKELVEEKIKDENGNVPVVCTPSGKEQTVRIQVQPDWLENLSDQEILSKINEGRN
jgi:DNA-binding protein YbaB